LTTDEFKKPRIENNGKLIDEFFSLSEAWSLSIEEQKQILGEKAIERLTHVTNHQEVVILNDESLSRLALIASIRKDIEALFSALRCNTYIRSQNKAFDNNSPLEVILESPDIGLPRDRKYLMEAILGGYC